MKMSGYSGTPLAQKLGIKPGSKLCTVAAPGHYDELLAPLPEGVQRVRKIDDADVAHFFLTSRARMEKDLRAAVAKMQPDAAIWISWPKKAAKVATDITEDTIREVALPLGLVDIKVCAVDETWSGLKLVIRKELRKPPAARDAEAFVEPAGHPADHDLHRPPEPREPHGCTMRAVAMRAGAVNDEHRVARIAAQYRLDELAMRDVHGRRRVTVRVEIGTAHIDQREVLPAVADGVVHVPAVGLEAECALEVRQRGGAVGGCDLGDGRRHESSPGIVGQALARQHPICTTPFPPLA